MDNPYCSCKLTRQRDGQNMYDTVKSQAFAEHQHAPPPNVTRDSEEDDCFGCGTPAAWTATRHDGPDHLGLRCDAHSSSSKWP